MRALLLLLTGCSIGMGPSTAATRPVLGQTMKDDDAKMWVVSSDQSHVPGGFVRVEQVSDGFARVFNWFSITSAVRKGTTTAAGPATGDKDVIELDLAGTFRIPLPVGGVSIGGGRVWDLEDKADLAGWGVRASFAPIGQLSLDFAHSWASGQLEMDSGTTIDLSGTHTSLGATLLLWGYNEFRWGVAVAKTWTDAGAYTSEGYTYSLIGTMY